MLVMKVVDKEFLFPSTYLLLFWNRSPEKKLNTSFFFLFFSLSNHHHHHHPCPFAYEIHLQQQPLHPRLSIAHAGTGGLCHIAFATSQGETAVFRQVTPTYNVQ